MAVKVKLKKWGNSLGCIIPKEIVDSEGFKENDDIQIIFVRNEFDEIFGSLKTKTRGQKFKDMVRDLND